MAPRGGLLLRLCVAGECVGIFWVRIRILAPAFAYEVRRIFEPVIELELVKLETSPANGARFCKTSMFFFELVELCPQCLERAERDHSSYLRRHDRLLNKSRCHRIGMTIVLGLVGESLGRQSVTSDEAGDLALLGVHVPREPVFLSFRVGLQLRLSRSGADVILVWDSYFTESFCPNRRFQKLHI